MLAVPIEEVLVVQFLVVQLVCHGLAGGGVDLAVTAGDGGGVAGALCVVGVSKVGAFGVGEPVQRCRIGVGAQHCDSLLPRFAPKACRRWVRSRSSRARCAACSNWPVDAAATSAFTVSGSSSKSASVAAWTRSRNS